MSERIGAVVVVVLELPVLEQILINSLNGKKTLAVTSYKYIFNQRRVRLLQVIGIFNSNV